MDKRLVIQYMVLKHMIIWKIINIAYNKIKSREIKGLTINNTKVTKAMGTARDYSLLFA